MTTIELFCASLLINIPVVPTLPPVEIYARCNSFYEKCTAQQAGKQYRTGKPFNSLQSDIATCAAERTDKDY